MNPGNYEYHRKRIRKALDAAGLYTPALELNIDVLAGSLVCHDLCMRDLEGLESACIVEETKYGTNTHAHPVFAVLRNNEDQIRKQMTELGLNMKGTRAKTEDDAVLDLAAAVYSEISSGKTVRPKA